MVKVTNPTYTDDSSLDPTKDYTLQELADFINHAKRGKTVRGAMAGALLSNWGLADGSVTHAKLAAGSVWTDKLADESVTAQKIAPGNISADRIDPNLVGSLIQQSVQTPMNLSEAAFNHAVPDLVSGRSYIQSEPVTGSGHLTYSVVISAADNYTFFTASKVPGTMNFKILDTQSISLKPGLVNFHSNLTAVGVTYYGMVIKSGSPMQRMGLDYPTAYATPTALDISKGVFFTGLLADDHETEGFFATIDNPLDMNKIVEESSTAASFIENATRQTFSQGDATVVSTSTTKSTGQALQGFDKDVWSFWGMRLANKSNVSFNGFSTRIQLSSLDPGSQKYRFCGQVVNLQTREAVYSYYDIDPGVDYTQPTKIVFAFNKTMYLADNLLIGVSIVDSDGNLVKTNSTGVMLTDGLDKNLYDDGTGILQHALHYSDAVGSVKNIEYGRTIVETETAYNYTGFEYELLSGRMKASYSIINQADGKLSTNNIHSLKWRPAEGNFSKVSGVYFLGRWFTTDQGVMTINQGAEVDARFSGTSLAADVTALANLPCLAVSIDGGAFNRVQMTASGSVPLASGLTAGDHYVRLITDGVAESDDLWTGHKGIIFNRFVVNGDTSIKTTPIRPANKVCWFIGDSITAGINVLGKGANPSVNSATSAYDFVCSQALSLVNIRIAFGATGMTTSGSGGVPAVAGYLDSLASGIPDTVQDYPDLVVINHGTNDKGAASAAFVKAYQAVLDRISVKLPGVPVYIMVPFNGSQSASFTQIIDGYPNVTLIHSDQWGIASPNDGHPDKSGHELAGQKLAELLKQSLGASYFIQ